MSEEEQNTIVALLRKEFSDFRTVVREDINAAVSASEQRLREEIGAVEHRLHGEITAVEQRTGEKFVVLGKQITDVDKRLNQQIIDLNEQITGIDEQMGSISKSLDSITSRLDRVENIVQPMMSHVVLLKAGHREIKSDFEKREHEHVQILSILDQTTVSINTLEANQRTLESKSDVMNGKIDSLEIRVRSLETKMEENTDSLKRDMQRLIYIAQGLNKQISDATTNLSRRLDIHENMPIDQAHPQSPHSAA